MDDSFDWEEEQILMFKNHGVRYLPSLRFRKHVPCSSIFIASDLDDQMELYIMLYILYLRVCVYTYINICVYIYMAYRICVIASYHGNNLNAG